MKLVAIMLVCWVGCLTAEPDINIHNYGYCGSAKGLVAFSMGSSTAFSPTTLTIIPLEVTIFNEGNHFHTDDNTFYAPEDGVYSFSFSALGSQYKRLSIHLFRQKGDAPKVHLARAGDYNYYGAYTAGGGSGGSVIVRLEKGEKISLWTLGGIHHGLYGESGHYAGGPSTLFSGKKESN